MSTNPTQLFEKLKMLPATRLAEVENFVDFLATKDNKRAALDRLLTIAPALEAAGGSPLSEEALAVEIKAARAERRARNNNNQTGKRS
jgi:hypothetical protein